MQAVILLLAVGLAVVAGVPRSSRIVGGSVTTIERYPYSAALLATWWGTSFSQACGGTILNNRAILTAAHCFIQLPLARQWRLRLGSTFANSGGVVHNVNRIINHPNFNRQNLDNDVSILHSATGFIFSNQLQAGSIAGANSNPADNQPVWAIGWGAMWFEGPASEQLRHVQVWIVNQNTCRTRYAELRYTVTDNMLCSGWLDVGGRDQCQGDSGGPLIHNGIVVGVCSWGEECALSRYPGVSARVSRYTAWIQSNA